MQMHATQFKCFHFFYLKKQLKINVVLSLCYYV